MSESESFPSDVPKPDVTEFSQRFFEARGTAVPRAPEVVAAEEEWQTDRNHPLRFLKEHNGQRNWLKIWGLLMPIYEDFKSATDKKHWQGPLGKQLFQDDGYDEAAMGSQRWTVVNMYIDYLMASAATSEPLGTTNKQWDDWDDRAVEAAAVLGAEDVRPIEPDIAIEPVIEPSLLRQRIRNSEPGDFTRDRAAHRKHRRDL